MEKETIYWHLPGIVYFGMINHLLFDTMKRFPEKFYENYKIGSVYGSMPGAIWNGGRNLLGGFSNKTETENIIKSYNTFGIPVRFTWTNVLLEEKHVYDTYCNMIMRAADNGMNQVLVNSPALEEYIRKTYPNFKVLSSTTKRITSVDRLMEEMEKDYFLVVLDYDFNHDEKVLEKLEPYAGRIEILVNEVCMAHCPNRANHYKQISKYQLEFDTTPRTLCTSPRSKKATLADCMQRPAFLSTKDIEEYSKRGFRNFKIVGRGEGSAFYVESLIYYLVKPEYREEMAKYFSDTLLAMRNAKPNR